LKRGIRAITRECVGEGFERIPFEKEPLYKPPDQGQACRRNGVLGI
jgi:hypothetical protein